MISRAKLGQTAALALLLGILAGAATFAAPADLIEAVVGGSGVAAFVPAAAPPLGLTARLALAVIALLLVAGFFVALMAFLERSGRLRHRRRRAARSADEDAPSLRRGDAHPDAPARRPLSALDLPLTLDMPEDSPGQPVAEDEPIAAFPLPEPPAAPDDDSDPHSIEVMMARLEKRLSERGGRPPAVTPEIAEKVDQPLREMMSSLHRAAARANRSE